MIDRGLCIVRVTTAEGETPKLVDADDLPGGGFQLALEPAVSAAVDG